MYNMPDIRKILETPVQVQGVQKTQGLMRRTAEELVQEEPHSPQEAILGHIQRFRQDIEEEGVTDALDEDNTSRALEEASGRPKPRPRRLGQGISGDVGGRSAAEAYLGRSMDDNEWEMLLRATYAEATDDPREQAGVMSVILNRVKSDQYPDSVVDVLNQTNQFQAVTGTPRDRNPSSRYVNMSSSVLPTFEEKVAPLLKDFAEFDWLNFTAANRAAYGPGTNEGFMEDVRRAQGSMRIGGTLFGTVGQ